MRVSSPLLTLLAGEDWLRNVGAVASIVPALETAKRAIQQGWTTDVTQASSRLVQLRYLGLISNRKLKKAKD